MEPFKEVSLSNITSVFLKFCNLETSQSLINFSLLEILRFLQLLYYCYNVGKNGIYTWLFLRNLHQGLISKMFQSIASWQSQCFQISLHLGYQALLSIINRKQCPVFNCYNCIPTVGCSILKKLYKIQFSWTGWPFQTSFMFMGTQDSMVSRVIRLHAGWPEI